MTKHFPHRRIPLHTEVNGQSVNLDINGRESALSIIRDRLGLTGTKKCCSQGVCGACTAQVNDNPVVTCLLPATALEGGTVSTIEAIGAKELHPIQRAFIFAVVVLTTEFFAPFRKRALDCTNTNRNSNVDKMLMRKSQAKPCIQ